MISMHPNYVVDEQSNKKSVILPYDEWQLILKAMEELDDIKAYDQAKEKQDELIPFEQAVKEIKAGLVN